MFYDVSKRAYTLLGAYRVAREGTKLRSDKARGFSSLAFRLRGESRFTYGENTCVADENSVIYIPAGIDFKRSSEDEELIVLHLSCHGDEDEMISVLHADGVKEQFEILLSDWETGGVGYRNRCTSRLYRILETVEKGNSKHTDEIPEAIRKGVTYLSKHYRDKELSIAKLALLCNVSEVYFRRIFRECFGISPWQRVLELRFLYACELLRSGYYTVKEISALSGFSDVKYFRTAFSRRYGCPPGSYPRA